MTKNVLAVFLFAACFAVAASCGDNGNGSQDTVVEDTAPADQSDQQTDTPQDQPADAPPDGPVDVPVDPAGDDGTLDALPDESEDTADDEAVEDAGPDAEDAVEEPDGATECETSGGYCTTYAVVADPCVVCETDGFIPAPPESPAMGCTSGGVGASPWCCLPRETYPAESYCESTGGECYPPDDTDPCPIGWSAVYTPCQEGTVCCMPGESCG